MIANLETIKGLVTAYGNACSRTARAPRGSPVQAESFRQEDAARDALLGELGRLVGELGRMQSAHDHMSRAWQADRDKMAQRITVWKLSHDH